MQNHVTKEGHTILDAELLHKPRRVSFVYYKITFANSKKKITMSTKRKPLIQMLLREGRQ